MNLKFSFLFLLLMSFFASCGSVTGFISDVIDSASGSDSSSTILGSFTAQETPNESCENSSDPEDDPLYLEFSFSKNDTSYQVPLYANFDFRCQQSAITKAVITVHGISRNAESYYGGTYDSAAQNTDVTSTTLIIAPQFFTEEDISSDSSSELYWAEGTSWANGDASVSKVSSYSFLDTLLAHLNNTDFFPNLTSVVLVGHSAGGQFVHRYSAVNETESSLNYTLKYVVMNPGTYMYLSENRCDSFSTNSCDSFGEFDSADCSNYNEYPYGLEDRNDYANQVTDDEILESLSSRTIVYALGEEDNDPEDTNLTTNCKANAMGEHRYIRGNTYYEHVLDVLGDSTSSSKITVPGVGHSNRDMMESSQVECVVFDKNCDS